MRLPHFGQADGGDATLWPAGRRQATTFKNEPTQAPTKVKTAARKIQKP